MKNLIGQMSKSIKHTVNLGTKHTVFNVKKWVYNLIIWGRLVVYLTLGCGITWFIYDKCLFNPNANTVAVGFFALIALSCFRSCGFPIKEIESNIVTS